MAKWGHQDVLDDIGRRIVAGDLAAGEVLTLADLEQTYDVSRTMIRETVKVLESIGMVESRRRVGVTVRPAQEWDTFDAHLVRWNLTGPQRQTQLEHLMELRSAIEPTAARLAASRASFDQGASLVSLAEQLQQLGDQGMGASPEYLEVDIEFHSLLLRASGNPMFETLIGPICEALAGRTALGLTPAIPEPTTLIDHLGAARAVAARDSEAAQRHALNYTSTVWREIVQAEAEPPQTSTSE